MADQPQTPDSIVAADPLPLPESSHSPIELPQPPADWLLEIDSHEQTRDYFDPEGWDAEIHNQSELPDNDPIAEERGKQEGRGQAALFLADLHIADGSAGGDDFLESHILPDESVKGLYTGFFPPGRSR